ENVGDSEATFTFYDGGMENSYTLEGGEELILEEDARFDEYSDNILPRSYLSFSYGVHTYYAVTQNIDLVPLIPEPEPDVVEEDAENEDGNVSDEVDNDFGDEVSEDESDDNRTLDDIPDNLNNGTEIEDSQLEEDKPSIFSRIWQYIKKLIGLD
ncbi:MAG: hypothetical protein ACOCUR_01280, partial [Nanoarchaeota archaeon]